MLVNITFKDLVSCNPVDYNDLMSDVAVTTQGQTFIVPFVSFQEINKNDGKSIIINVQTYSLSRSPANDKEWRFCLTDRQIPILTIPADLIGKIDKVK